MLQLCNAPRYLRKNLLMAGPDQQQICQYRHTKGFLDPSLLPTHLVCSQSQIGLEFLIDLLHGPSALVGTNPLPRDPLVQIGHENFRMLRADGRYCFRLSPVFVSVTWTSCKPRVTKLITSEDDNHCWWRLAAVLWSHHRRGLAGAGAQEAMRPEVASL